MKHTPEQTINQTNACDIILLNLPSKVIDRPSLCLPVLTSHLRAKGYQVEQRDQNMLFNDLLLREESLIHLLKTVLPVIQRYNFNNRTVFTQINNFLKYLKKIETDSGFGKVEHIKKTMQSRDYACLADIANINWVKNIFDLNEFFYTYFPVCIYYGAFLEQNNIREIIYHQCRELIAYLIRKNPYVVGLSVFERQREFSLWFGEKLRKNFAHTIMLGGSDPTLNQEKYFHENEWLDFIVVGEGEDVVDEILKVLKSGGTDYSHIKNLIYKQNGALVKTALYNKPIGNFIIPDYDGYPLNLYIFNVFQIITSKGCQWSRCRFCMHWNSYGNEFSHRKVSDVADEIRFLQQKYGVSFFVFVDEALNPNYGKTLSEEINSRGLNIRWLAMTRLDSQFDKKILDTWFKGGCRFIEWGLETGSQNVINDMDKGISIQDAQKIIFQSSRAGIINKMLMFYNYPVENCDDLFKSMEIIRKNTEMRQLKPMLTLRHKFVLKRGSILEDIAFNRQGSAEFKKYFYKVWQPEGFYNVNCKHITAARQERIKLRLINQYLNRMHKLIEERKIFITNNTNITMDLVLSDLEEKNIRLPVDVYGFYKKG